VQWLALLLSFIALVPLDDRPVTAQLPVMLGRIAGVPVHVPPRILLGHYLHPGQPDRIIAWLNGRQNRGADAIVLSSDMLVYGGLVASRVPDSASYQDGYFRLRALRQVRATHPHAWIAAFGTIMRLAPTGVPAIGSAAGFFAAYPTWTYLQQYANLHDPPLPQEREEAATLRAEAGPAFDAYLAARARNYAVDRTLIDAVSAGVVNRLVLGQDDAGPVGLHVKDVYGLEQAAKASGAAGRIAIEPGADELGMVLVAHALARRTGWEPRVAVRYSTPLGAAYQDPLEFAPIGVTIGHLIALCGGGSWNAIRRSCSTYAFPERRKRSTMRSLPRCGQISPRTVGSRSRTCRFSNPLMHRKRHSRRASGATASLGDSKPTRPGIPTRTRSERLWQKRLPPEPAGAPDRTTRWRTATLRLCVFSTTMRSMPSFARNSTPRWMRRVLPTTRISCARWPRRAKH